MREAMIIPACDDQNRGDQALIWQTRQLIDRAVRFDKWSMLAETHHDTRQSEEAGFHILEPLLKHPASRYNPKSNLKYGPFLVVVWGVLSVLDAARSTIFLTALGRRFGRKLLTTKERGTLDAFVATSAFFVKGGGFIHSTSSVTDPYKAFYLLYHVLLAQSLRKPVVILPNSFGPFEGRLYRSFVTWVLRRCTLVTTRESISHETLQANSITAKNYHDLAFSLAASSTPPTIVEKMQERAGGRQIVAITARPYRFPGAQNPQKAYETYVNEFSKLVSRLQQEGFFPVFVEHVLSTGEHESDISAIKAISDRLASRDFMIVSDENWDCRDLKFIYSGCDFVIGTRFHSVIFALAEGVPALAIGYGGNKSQGIMTDLGIPQYVVDMGEFKANVAWERFHELRNDQRVRDVLNDLPSTTGASHDGLIHQVRECLGAL